MSFQFVSIEIIQSVYCGQTHAKDVVDLSSILSLRLKCLQLFTTYFGGCFGISHCPFSLHAHNL